MKEILGILYSDLGKFVDPNFEEKFNAGEILCGICGHDTQEAGLSAVKQENDKIIWCCQKFNCKDEF